jgi:hypothetical protein
MPRRPDFSRHRQDPRFDRYRGRVGRLLRGSDEAGLVLVIVEPYAEQVGGHLWWRRWGPTHDLLWLWTVVDGQYSDSLVPDDASEEELHDYDTGRYLHYGEDLTVLWMDADGSKRLSAAHFGR